MLKKFVSILLIINIFIYQTACNLTPISPSISNPQNCSTSLNSDANAQQYEKTSAQATADKFLTKKDQQEIQTYISEIVDSVDLSWRSGYLYLFEKEKNDKLCQIGYKGLPVLLLELEKMVDDKAHYLSCVFLASSAYALLRVDERYNWVPKNDGYSSCSKRTFYTLYSTAKKQIPQTLNEDINVSEKIAKMRHFGILALPFITEEIEKGNTEYESYFTAIGLHMDVPEFMVYMTDYEVPYEERFAKEGFMDGAEDFDYKVWYKENKEDLDNLFKFLDAYCAEYEAEQNK